MSEPGLEVMATVEMVGAVLWAWATDTRPRSRAMTGSARSNLLNVPLFKI